MLYACVASTLRYVQPLCSSSKQSQHVIDILFAYAFDTKDVLKVSVP